MTGCLWQEFKQKYKINFWFHEHLEDIKKDVGVIALWFFRERNDRGAPATICMGEKNIPYVSNTFLLTRSKDFTIKHGKKRYIRTPVLQLNMSDKQYDELVQRIRKTKDDR